MFDNIQKQLDGIITDDGLIRYSVLDEAVRIATESLQSAQTELEFNNGIIAREKGDPNRLVLLNSKGIGISDDGGNAFREAITADGFVLTAGAIGRLSANHIQIGAQTEFATGYHPDASYLNTLKSEFEGIEERVATLVDNEYLGLFILNLLRVNENYKIEYTKLEDVIKDVINGDAETDDIDSKFEAYRTALKQLLSVIDEAHEEIAKNRDDELGSVVREDLRLTSPLPTSITMDNDGITAYVP